MNDYVGAEHTMDGMIIKLVPSKEGSSAFVRGGKRLTRIPLAGGNDALGMVMRSYERATLERLVHRGLVSRIELESADFLQHRSRIQELSRSIGTAALEAAFVRDINREIERILSAHRTSVHAAPHEVDVAGVMRSLLNAVRGERRATIEAAATLVKGLGAGVLRRIDEAVQIDPENRALHAFRTIVAATAARWEIPEYLALVILELVNNLQVQTMQSVAHRSGMSAERIRSLYMKPEVRDQIRSLMERQGETSAIAWSFVTHEGSGARTTELTVSMTGKGSSMRGFTTEIERKGRVDVGERSIEEFYNGLNDSAFNIDLGLYYLSYLEDLARKADMRFSTRVRELATGGETVVSLRIDL